MHTTEERDTMRAIQTIAKTMRDSKNIDWESRRYEIAKEIYIRRVSELVGCSSNRLEGEAENAVECADALIEYLKKTINQTK